MGLNLNLLIPICGIQTDKLFPIHFNGTSDGSCHSVRRHTEQVCRSKRDGIFVTDHMVSYKLYLLSFVLSNPVIVKEYAI